LFGATWRCGLPVRGLPEGVAGHDRALNMPKSERSKVLFCGSLSAVLASPVAARNAAAGPDLNTGRLAPAALPP
jgi:hypothetical protein